MDINEARQLIERYGSKLGMTRAIMELGLDKPALEGEIGEEIPIPNSAWIYAEQDIGLLLNWFEKAQKPVIVRGCHANDLDGYIDVLPTTKHIYTFKRLEEAVAEIWQAAANDALRIHCEDWNQPFTGTADILVQEQWGSPEGDNNVADIFATIIRHPHLKDTFIIQGYDRRALENTKKNERYASYTIAGEEVIIYPDRIKGCNNTIHEYDARKAVELYLALEEAGILDKQWSYQIEMLFRPLVFLQARRFKKIEPAQDFNVLAMIEDGIPYLNARTSFGITPPSGTKMYFTVENEFSLHRETSKEETGEYGMILIDSIKHQISIDVRYGNIGCFALANENERCYLYHHNYRFLKKARISMMIPISHKGFMNGATKETLKMAGNWQFKESIVVANGKEGVIIPARYLDIVE